MRICARGPPGTPKYETQSLFSCKLYLHCMARGGKPLKQEDWKSGGLDCNQRYQHPGAGVKGLCNRRKKSFNQIYVDINSISTYPGMLWEKWCQSFWPPQWLFLTQDREPWSPHLSPFQNLSERLSTSLIGIGQFLDYLQRWQNHICLLVDQSFH